LKSQRFNNDEELMEGVKTSLTQAYETLSLDTTSAQFRRELRWDVA
jgi:hypothetical protein